jgi:hypothetical protein
MSEKGCHTKGGMTADKQAFSHNRFSRALRIFDHHFGETTLNPVPESGNGNDTYQPYYLDAEQWRRTIAEVTRHNTYR